MRALAAVAAVAAVLALLVLPWPTRAGPRSDRGDVLRDDAPAAAVDAGGGPGATPASTSPGADGAAEEPAEPRTRVCFTLVDVAGTPVRDGTLDVLAEPWEDEPVRRSIAADIDGRVTVDLAEEEAVLVRAPGFQRRVFEEPFDEPEVIVLHREYRMAGVILDAADRPIPGARVSAAVDVGPKREIVTGPDGVFAFGGFGTEEVSLDIHAEGFLRLQDTVYPGDTEMRIVLYRGVTLRGVVALEGGGSPAGVELRAWFATAVADENGQFTLAALPPGPMEVYAWRNDPDALWRGQEKTDLGKDGGTAALRIVLDRVPRSWVAVRVLDGEGRPAPGEKVAGQGVEGQVTTAADGRALCPFNLPPGTPAYVYVVSQGSPTFQAGQPLQGRADVVTRADPGGPEVVLRPRQPARVTVVARGPGGEALPAGVVVRLNLFGATRIEGAPDRATFLYDPAVPRPGLQAQAAGFLDHFGPIDASPGAMVEVRLRRAAAVRLRLVRADGTAVLRGAVTAWVPGGPSMAAEEAGDDGAFLLQGLAPGEARIHGGFEWGMPLAEIRVPVESCRVADAGTLVLGSPVQVRGRVTDAKGHALGGVRLSLVDADVIDPREALTREDGRFELTLPPSFRGHLVARRRGYGDTPVAVAAADAGQEMHVVLQPAGSARLRVVVPPFWSGGLGFDVRIPGIGVEWNVEWRRIADHPPTYLLTGLPPGPLILLAGGQETEVVVPVGGMVDAEIRIPR